MKTTRLMTLLVSVMVIGMAGGCYAKVIRGSPPATGTR